MSTPDLVISRGRTPAEGGAAGPAGASRDFEDRVAQAFRARGQTVLIVPPVYDLTPGHAAARSLAALSGPLTVLAWLHPRAALWTLRSLGLEGPVECVDLGRFATVDACVAAIPPGSPSGRPGHPGIGGPSLRSSAPEPPGEPAPAGSPTDRSPGAVEELAGAVREAWYPVIDMSRCTSCGQCLDYCLFGVFGRTGSGRTIVSSPDACRPGCPACARICPAAAIMFPLHAGDPAIAGAPGTTIRRMPVVAPRSRQADAVPGGAPDRIDDIMEVLRTLDE